MYKNRKKKTLLNLATSELCCKYYFEKRGWLHGEQHATCTKCRRVTGQRPPAYCAHSHLWRWWTWIKAKDRSIMANIQILNLTADLMDGRSNPGELFLGDRLPHLWRPRHSPWGSGQQPGGSGASHDAGVGSGIFAIHSSNSLKKKENLFLSRLPQKLPKPGKVVQNIYESGIRDHGGFSSCSWASRGHWFGKSQIHFHPLGPWSAGMLAHYGSRRVLRCWRPSKPSIGNMLRASVLEKKKATQKKMKQWDLGCHLTKMILLLFLLVVVVVVGQYNKARQVSGDSAKG